MSDLTVFDSRLENEKETRCKIAQWLDSEGYHRGLHGFCKHNKGLPTVPNVMVRPTHSHKKGSRALMVTATHVLDVSIQEPYKGSFWEVDNTYEYTTREQLKDMLDKLVYLDTTAWDDLHLLPEQEKEKEEEETADA